MSKLDLLLSGPLTSSQILGPLSEFWDINAILEMTFFFNSFILQGDQVDEFQRLCEVQSDKATIEITSRFKGKVHQIHFGPGDIVKVALGFFFNLNRGILELFAWIYFA